MNLKKGMLVALVTLACSGCAAQLGMAQGGLVYRNVTMPLTAAQYGPGSKVGKATAVSLFGLFNTGDAGIEAAKRSAGITKISHVDYQSVNVLGAFSTFTVIVYGD